jgi:hypothetical protein
MERAVAGGIGLLVLIVGDVDWTLIDTAKVPILPLLT